MNKTKSWLIIALNSLIVIAVIVSLYFMGTRTMTFENYSGALGFKMFLFVNADASLVLALGAVTMIIYATMYLVQKRPNLQFLRYAYVFKLVATVWSAFVFLLIVLMLGPMTGYPAYLSEYEQSILNIVLPLVAIFIFIFLEYKKTSKIVIVYSAIPAVLYIFVMLAVVYSGACQNAIGEEAPYALFYFKTNPAIISLLGCLFLIGGTFGIGAAIYFANWAMFEKAYPRIATHRYQKRLQEMKKQH